MNTCSVYWCFVIVVVVVVIDIVVVVVVSSSSVSACRSEWNLDSDLVSLTPSLF